uniref:Uncharacterized protein n=1 Tax=Setaria italica TaxID=4555 RepID=K3Y473_SETIT
MMRTRTRGLLLLLFFYSPLLRGLDFGCTRRGGRTGGEVYGGKIVF